MKFPDCKRDDLKYPLSLHCSKTDFSGDDSILNTIRTRDLFPALSLSQFFFFLACTPGSHDRPERQSHKNDPYRVAKKFQGYPNFNRSSQKREKVTVVIELLARFDEASNISWSKQMQDAGIKVVFGVEGLKIHAKLVYISGRQGDIACVSTGNFHEGNATRYTDVTLLPHAKPW